MSFAIVMVLQIAIAAFFVMLANDAETIRESVSYKRNGALRFVRVGRLSFSYCIRKA